MMKYSRNAALALTNSAMFTFLVVGAPASAQEALIGLGWNALDGDDSALAGFVEGRTGSLASLRVVDLRLGASVQADVDGDFWVGAGPVATVSLTDALRVEASVMPGYYDQGDGADLGYDLEFRSMLGLSYAVRPGTRLGVSVSHMSNASLDDDNPGEDSAFAYVAQSFCGGGGAVRRPRPP
jgi:hypothetical protein